ncbi:MAG: hypothetical protein WD058_05160 [Dehalococcoidia bacterium]
MRHQAGSQARALAERGMHRAEALRHSLSDSLGDSLPDAQDRLHDLREQAQPVLDRARERAMDMAVERGLRRKRSRSKKPLLLVALLAIAGGVAAYIYFSRRDEEPAYLVHEPDAPDAEPAGPTSPGGSTSDRGPSGNGWGGDPSPSPSTPQREMAGALGGHHPTPPPAPQAANPSVPFASAGSTPAGRTAAWDLPR